MDGYEPMRFNLGGNNNTAVGNRAMYQNTDSENTAVGAEALLNKTTGGSNIAIGYRAGLSLGNGSSNIYIGNGGANENSTMRIGSGTQTRAFIAGIRGVTTGSATGIGVLIDINGQLGTLSSSRLVKQDIADMGEASGALLRLRPVTFRYKESAADGAAPLEYGLIAEEVADVVPDAVVRSATGDIETVQYHKINALLLNEVQKQHRAIEDQRRQLREQAALIAELQEQQRRLKEQTALIAELLARQGRFEAAAPVATAPGR